MNKQFIRNKSYRFKYVAASLFVLLILTACSSGQLSNQEKEQEDGDKKEGETLGKIRYAAFTGVSGLAVRLGAEKGFFAEEGLEVEFVTTQNPVEGLVSKEVDIADVPTTVAIVAAGKGAPLKIVSSLFRTKGPFYLVAQPEIESVEDLKGKKVGAGAFGSGLDVYTQTILSKHGLNKSDVSYIANGAHEAAYASLTTKQVAATIIHEPFASLAEINKTGKIIAKGWDYLPTFHTGVIAANDSFIEKHPEKIKKALRAYFKSQQYAKENMDEYRTYFLQHVKVDEQAVDKAFEREEVLWENNPNVDQQMLLDTQQIQVELGFQDKVYDIEQIVDLSFIPQGQP